MIITYEAGVRQIIAAAVTRARSIVREYAIPIYGTDQGRPDHIGTSFLIEHGKGVYFLTAAHVLDHLTETPLFAGAGGNFIPVLGSFFNSLAPNGNRAEDRFDFAWCRIDESNSRLLEFCKVIPAKSISKNRIDHDKRVYLAVGYPNSKNKVPWQGHKIVPQRATYYSTFKEHKTLFDKLGISHETHLSIAYDRKALDEDYNIVNAINPKGISGGPFFDLGRIVSKDDLGRQTALDPLLSGLVIEYHKAHKAMLAVKIDTILARIDSTNTP
ncbi:hypothetical protein E4416_00630 [Stenotrophomonas maltophilia]|uniref:hypothetical protein n=1 Tax=Stenotrophomonas maltophilia TaxID=40324 RepID=UPI0011109BD5|nr:hypothetical protein [Stenotrophomonas maltophilia]TIK68272.1 hypothetical protein E4418_09470 [Stenotrophomonas maltophilia]TIK75430.1 hypothetical protein E4416_00630 [Stenotrophomonas maltophilia]